MLPLHSVATREDELLYELAQARGRTDDLFSIVKPESLYERPIAERNRIVFYIGHLEAFDWNLLRERLLHAAAFHPEFDRLFAFGIDPVDGGLPSDVPSDWPAIAEVREYVRRTRQAIDNSLRSLASSLEGDSSADQLLNVAIEHRLMHAETLAYMLHQLAGDNKLPPAQKPELVTPAHTPGMVEVPAGAATLGLARNSGAFGWDNEFEQQTIEVPSFNVDRFKVSNGEYLEFLESGGYGEKRFWGDADWDWKTQGGISHPVFWRQDSEQWLYRTMFQEIPLPLEWPVYVSHAEANAYARWHGKELPSEPQWHRAAYGTPEGTERQYPWGSEAPGPKHGNFDFQRWNPTPVNAFPDGQSAFGVDDLLGNGWEWTSSIFGPLPGFQAFSFYPGYSADFFDGRHFVMKGGSTRTAAVMLRRSFRNWFQGHYQYVYASFRCVRA